MKNLFFLPSCKFAILYPAFALALGSCDEEPEPIPANDPTAELEAAPKKESPAESADSPKTKAKSERPVLSSQIKTENYKYFNQGWDTELRHDYYFTAQGSHLMPYDWFLAIETQKQDTPFSSPENLRKYGWSWPYEDASAANPDNLPIGFTKGLEDYKDTGKWVGWTCAACHTGELAVNGTRYRIDGGPADVDIGVFLKDFAQAVQANIATPSKFARFSKRVLGDSPAPEDLKTLKEQYLLYTSTLNGRVAMRSATHPEGPGRVDALGQIITAMSVFQLGEGDNYQSPDAPVSYPFLWYTPKLSWVQWSPISSNPIGRNAGEVLGVFGHADFVRPEEGAEAPRSEESMKVIEKQPVYEFLARNSVPEDLMETVSADAVMKKPHELEAQNGFLSSTANYRNLYALEKWIDDLSEPKWDEAVFGKIDREMGKRGAKLFNQDCRMCHNMPPFDLTPKEENIVGKQFIKIGKIPYKVVGTDPTYIESLSSRLSKTGDLGPVIFEGEQVVPAARFFLGGVAAVVEKGLNDLGLSPKEKLEYSDYRYYPPETPGADPKPYVPTSITELKAGPLLGIWATGPFLHNGSVPNLYELISSPESRSDVFYVGNREFDTKNLGYVSEQAPDLFRFDTTLKGNGNGGHVYPSRPYTEDQKWELLEFLKDPTYYTQAQE